MPRKKVDASIIIVHYRVKKELFALLDSLERSKPKAVLEIIIIDNDETKTIKEPLRNRFPKLRYIASLRNIGYGAGNNLGAKAARGEFLFFLNPDTIVTSGTIDILIAFLKKHKNAAVVAPLLLQTDKKPFSIQGSEALTPFTALFALSFVNKYFPDNPVSKNFFLRNWDKKVVRQVQAVPGSAFMIRKEVFEEVGGFDENFFLFFEEHDLGLRVKKLGYKLFISPVASVVHLGAASTRTQKSRETDRMFKESRFYYFKKHFGYLAAKFVELLC